MQEDYLHYIWMHKKFEALNLKTTQGEPVEIVFAGWHNYNSGPDFFNAQLRIGGQLWAGNVEIHIKSSDWYIHHHETDANYDNVVLHVVWEHDTDIFRKDNSAIPTLELKSRVPEVALEHYYRLFDKGKRWINCEKDFEGVDEFRIQNWLERLYFERLERKSREIEEMLAATANDWEAVLFKMLVKNFGLKVNAASFLSLSNSFDFAVIRKHRSQILSLEALFFGQAGLLETDLQEVYVSELRSQYQFLKQKFRLSHEDVLAPQFFRLRPSNFPTIRLSQLANLYHKQEHLFSKVIETKDVGGLYSLFSVPASAFWDDHYTFAKITKHRKKMLTRNFIDLLIINTIIPLKFGFAKHRGEPIDDHILKIIGEISSEKNSIVDKFNALKPVSKSALQSQALLQLKNEYCDKNNCMQCAIGHILLTGID